MSASPSPLHAHPPPSNEVLGDWLNKQDIVRHPALQPVEMCDGGGWRMTSEDDIGVGTVLCSVPKQVMFSHRTASFSLISPLDLDNSTSSEMILHLAACLLHELRLGTESAWYGYLQVLPRNIVMVPTFWADARLGGDDGRRALEWLAGTEGERELRRKAGEGLTMEDMDRYHETISSHQPPTTEHPEPSSFVSYVYAVSLVMTRAVVIDAYHGIAIVPFCDLLNHSSSTAHTSFCCDAFVCPICGSLTVCEHDSSDLERLAHLPQSYIDEMEEQGNVVDMRVVRAIKKGEEVFSLYDEGMGDGKLLVEWGFIERNGAGDGLIWSPRELLNGTTARLYMTLINGSYLDDTAQRRTVSTQKDPINWRLIAPPDAERNPLLNVYPSGRVSIYLLTALYLQLKDDGAKLADVEDAGREIIEAVDEIEQRHLGDGSALTSTPALLVQHVVQLLEARMSKVYRPDLSAHDLVTINTDLPTSAPLERMALGLAIDERALMEGVLSKWRSLSQ